MMMRQLDSKVWANQSQQTTGNVTIIFPEHNHRQSQHVHRFIPVVVQRVHVNSRIPQQHYNEYLFDNKETYAATGRWVLNSIAALEEYKKALKANKNQNQSNKKKHSFQSRISSRVEPIENLSSQFNQTQYPHPTILSSTIINDNITTPLSSFSSAASVDHISTQSRSSISSRTRSNSQSRDCSTDEFKDSKNKSCISKRIIIACTILSIILIIGIIIAVLTTIFVGKNQSSSSSSNSSGKNSKSLRISFSTMNNMICPIEMFNLTDQLCNGQIPYQYYSCYKMVTSTLLTIRFAFQHDTISGHWYFDDIMAVQNENIQLIVNGGFENNLTGWIMNITSNSTSETYVDTMIGLAHTGSAYLHGGSKNYPIYIEQTFNVTIGEYINISFWWGYDGGFKIGNTCQAIGQLISSF